MKAPEGEEEEKKEQGSLSLRLLKYSSDSLGACLLIVTHEAGERSEKEVEGEEEERGGRSRRRRNWEDEQCSLCACRLIVKHDAHKEGWKKTGRAVALIKHSAPALRRKGMGE